MTFEWDENKNQENIEKHIVTVRFTMRNENIRILGAGYWREGRNKYEQKKRNLH